MSIRTIHKTAAFGKAFVFGESDESAPTDASNLPTGEPNASLKQEQADRQSVESAENEGMSVHPGESSATNRRNLPNAIAKH
jgi:phage-related protein